MKRTTVKQRRGSMRWSSRLSLKRNLLTVYGVGQTKADQVMQSLGLLGQDRPTKHTRKLLDQYVDRHVGKTISGKWVPATRGLAMKQQTVEMIQRLQNGGTTRGMRRRLGLPVRGQRTKTNGRTAHWLNSGKVHGK